MKRREFLQCLGIGLAGGWVFSRPFWPRVAAAGVPELRLAVLADAHLKNGDGRRPEAQALARAVAELRGLTPAPDLVLFAGDLAHGGNPAALALGKEILADLPAPLLMVMGEGDGLPDGAAAWRRLFGDPWFSHLLPKTENGKLKTVLQVLGLHTAWCPGPGGPLFRVGESGRHWLARELARLDPEAPLLVLSHAPLDPIYRPWSQWTLDGPEVLDRLGRFRRVLCIHGHTHCAGVRGQGLVSSEQRAVSNTAGVRGQWPGVSNSDDQGEILLTKNGLLHLSLPATAWPWPQALQGTPARPGPGLGPSGCGWVVLAGRETSLTCESRLWRA